MGKTLTEKIFETHVVDRPFDDIWVLRLDEVFCHEITTPIAINDLVSKNLDRVFDPKKIKAVIDHVSPAKDSKTAQQGKILREWARRHQIKDFFDIGRNGVCHALFPEKGFVRPGYALIMGDSHTCTHGAFGAFAAGVGTADLEVGILKGVCAFRLPQTLKINLKGSLPPGVFPKDVILAIIAKIGVSGANGKVIEFHGQPVSDMSMEGRMTLCNMAIEAGAACGICMPDMRTVEYLWPFVGPDGEKTYSSREQALEDFSRWTSDESAVYSAITELDCSALEPLVTVGYKPDEVKPIRSLEGKRLDQVYIGSCTNGRIEDLRAAAAVLKGRDGKVRKIADTVRAIVSPATTDIFAQALREGLIQTFLDAGFCVTNATCGACLGMSGGVLADGEVCASTTNRNFYGRMGGGGMIHLMSPASAARAAIAGSIVSGEGQ